MIREADAANTLAETRAMRTFRHAELAFLSHGADESLLFESAVCLAEQARLRGALPEDILCAMRIAGCVRSDNIIPADGTQASRYWIVLSAVLRSYYGTDS